MSHLQADSREEVLNAFSLKDLLAEKTANEFSVRWERTHPKPAFGMTILSFGIALLLTLFSITTAAGIFWILTLLQLIWAGVVVALQVSSSVSQKKELIRRGVFPPETATMVFNRLRWWNHLIVPQNWARHSRIHDRKYKLEHKVQELEKAIATFETEEAEHQEVLDNLPKQDIPALAAQIKTWAQRMEHETRITTIEDELVRLHEEFGLFKALLLKVKQVTDKLEQIEKLGLSIKHTSGGELNELIQKSVQMLENRRQLVQQVDHINPSEFLELVRV